MLALTNSAGSQTEEPAFLILGAGNTLTQGKRTARDVGGRYTSQHFLELFNSKCTPPLSNFSYEEVQLDGNTYGVITIPPSPDLHYCTIDLVTPTRTWSKNSVLIRHGEKVGVAAPEEIARLLSTKRTWQKKPSIPIATDPLRKVYSVLIKTPLDFKRTLGVEGASQEVWCKTDSETEPEIRRILKEIFQDLQYLEHDELDEVMNYLDAIEEPLQRLSKLNLEIFCIVVPTPMKTSDGTPFEFEIAHYYIVPKDAFFALHGPPGAKVHRFTSNCQLALLDFLQSVRKQARIQLWNAIGLLLQFKDVVPFCTICCEKDATIFDDARKETEQLLKQNAEESQQTLE